MGNKSPKKFKIVISSWDPYYFFIIFGMNQNI